ncbi:MAG: hypothetical protein ACI8Q6_003254 [Granulosicoccus sp.]|jgi:hypothetical protein
MAHIGRYHGGLVFVGTQENTLDQFSRIVSATLEDYDHHVERQSVMNTQMARVTTSQYLVKLNLGVRGDLGRHSNPKGAIDCSTDDPLQRLEITLCPVDPARSDQTHSELLLAVMMYRMVEAYSAEYVEWLDPKTALGTQDFLGAFSSVSPRRVRGRQQILEDRQHASRFVPVDETAPNLSGQYDAYFGQKRLCSPDGPVSLTEQEALSLAFRLEPHPNEIDAHDPEDMRDNNVRRLASWGKTGVMVLYQHRWPRPWLWSIWLKARIYD